MHIIRKLTKGWFDSWIWFHTKFHKTRIINIEDRDYVCCDTCKSYVPPMPVGMCRSCKNSILLHPLRLYGNLCKKCFFKSIKDVIK